MLDSAICPDFQPLFLEERLAGARVERGIPRFTPDAGYSAGNFSRLREEHATLQLDSRNGSGDRLRTILARTGWAPEFFRGKTVLECGCGAGPDTEILLALGARVLAVDLAGLDVARANVGEAGPVQFAQASILDLPLRPRSFDVVFCHRVLQHTPDPEATLRHILGFVREDGAVFVHSYARTAFQMLRWKYLLRPVTRRLPPELLYRAIRAWAWPAFHLTNWLRRRGRLGRAVERIAIPFCNYRYKERFRDQPDSYLVEYGLHDTFDALSPRYDRPIRAAAMRAIAAERLHRPFEILEDPTITLLRTLEGGEGGRS